MKHYRHIKSQAFTLIEVMVVVVIMAILAAIIVPQILSRPDQAREVAAKQDILSIENAMELYKLDNGLYPSSAQGVDALVTKPSSDPAPQNWSGPYIKGHVPKDPWGNAYHFQNPGQHGDIDIFTYGAKNQPGGKGADATIGNWDTKNKSAQ
ncbi:MAG: type II secretion system protein GspG [Coxiella sp. (in: Bacteria)]|nr:MAG: type II secretion system protein GspG [Coxiella sp. (in: g-proteobacteria)]